MDADTTLYASDIVARSIPAPADLTGIYSLILQGEIVYVGQGDNVLLRMFFHHSKGIKQVDTYYYIPCLPADLNEIEAYYIFRFKPRHNRCLPNNSRYLSITQLMAKLGKDKRTLRKFIRVKGLRRYLYYYDLEYFRDLACGHAPERKPHGQR